MTTKAAQYLNEIVSLSILVLMIVALAAGQADAMRVANSEAESLPGSHVLKVAPASGAAEAVSEGLVEMLTLSVGGLDGHEPQRSVSPAGATRR
jgi:hypothetical protein